MAGGAEDLIKMLYEMVQDAFSLPFGSDRCILDRDKLLGLIDEISAILPSDLKQARSIVESRNDIISAAKREAEALKRQAEERARQLVSQEEILATARRKANEIVTAAETKSRDIRRTASEYVDNALKLTEEVLSSALHEVRDSRTEFRTAAGKQPSA
jgi:vacuolar-type H+-ATPase subunit H